MRRTGPLLPPPSKLSASVRRAHILEAVRMDGFVGVGQVAESFGVSEMTIRRDLLALQQEGRLARTHGGATAAPEPERGVLDLVEPDFVNRQRRNADAKMRMARAAARLIGPGETIGLDIGSSTLALAAELVARSDLRILTTSIRASLTLSASRSSTYMLGGAVHGPEPSVIGTRTVQELANYNLDRVFPGVSGLIADGFFDYSIEDTEVKHAFIARAAQTIILCDASKFGRRSLARVCELSAADVVVTDAEPPAELGQALANAGVEVVVAPEARQGRD